MRNIDLTTNLTEKPEWQKLNARTDLETGRMQLYPKRIYDVPSKPLGLMAVKLNIMGALAWDYADTVLDIAASMKLSSTRAASRAIRAIRLDYDRFRSSSMDDSSVDKERELAELFEEICRATLSKLNYGLLADKNIFGLDKEWQLLVNSVQMAMTVLDAMKIYAAECDKWIRDNGVWGHSILPDQFSALSILLPQFAGDRYNCKSEPRRITAQVLVNEMKNIDIYDTESQCG